MDIVFCDCHMWQQVLLDIALKLSTDARMHYQNAKTNENLHSSENNDGNSNIINSLNRYQCKGVHSVMSMCVARRVFENRMDSNHL